MPHIRIPDKVRYILKTLRSAGFEAYVVGGCVRDCLIGRQPGDWDITTSALPLQVKALFRRTIDTGLQHGTVTVMLQQDAFEVTTYRLDSTYSDGRHPDSVSFTTSLAEDLRRRDFTINAMAYAPDSGLVDLFGGLEDLRAGCIRAVGNPFERFDEDALRIMRAVRFAAQLGFAIEEQTLRAIHRFAERLRLISSERIREELVKLLVSPHPEMFSLLHQTGITAVIFPRFDEMLLTPQRTVYHSYNVGEHTLRVLQSIPAEPVLRLAALLHDTGKTQAASTDEGGHSHFKGHAALGAAFAEQFLRELRFDNHTIHDVCLLIKHHDDRFPAEPAAVRRALGRIGTELFPFYLALLEADCLGKSEYARRESLPYIHKLRELYAEVLRAGECFTLGQLAVKGGDLIKAGVKPGKQLGELLHQMLEDVLENPAHNTAEYLLGTYVPRE